MLKYKTGNLLEAKVEALVNTVNTVGVMGKGIALMFKEAFPENYFGYREACKSERVETGKMFVTECRNLMSTPRWIFIFQLSSIGATLPSWSGLKRDCRISGESLKVRT